MAVSPRIFDLPRASLATLAGRALEDCVRASEGRTMVSEVFASAPGLVDGVHNAELMAAHGADIILLNLVEGAWSPPSTWSFPSLGRMADLRELAATIGRPVGVNLEPDPRGDLIPPQRRATAENAVALRDAGTALFVVTANPGTHASYAGLVDVTKDLRYAVGGGAAIWVGKMHHAGRPERVTPEALLDLVDAGASGVLVPIPGTVPGVTRDLATAATEAVHERGAVVLGTIGTSQEGAPESLAHTLALMAKEIGVDAHHVGDAGYHGVGDPHLLHAYSLAVRGRRHTWRRMALGSRTPQRDLLD
jgi:hypothetical protein